MNVKTSELLKLKSIIFILLLFFLFGGCAIGTTELVVSHNELNKVQNKKSGNLLVKKFTDSRKDTNYIGNKRNGFGMVLGHVGLHDGENLESILTSYFIEALQESGYSVTSLDKKITDGTSEGNYDAVIEGDIIEFWMDLYMAVWHKVKVDIKAVNPVNNAILWENQISGDEKRVLWIGATGEYERIIREAITKTLNKALEEFTDEKFSTAITKKE